MEEGSGPVAKKYTCSLTNEPERKAAGGPCGRAGARGPQLSLRETGLWGRREARVPRAADSGTRRHTGRNRGRSRHRARRASWTRWTGGAEGPGEKASRRQRGTGSLLGAPGLHDAALGLVRVRLLEPQSLLGPVLLQVGELLAVDGSPPLPGETGQGWGQAGRASPFPYLLSRPLVLDSPCYHLLQVPPQRSPSQGPLVYPGATPPPGHGLLRGHRVEPGHLCSPGGREEGRSSGDR